MSDRPKKRVRLEKNLFVDIEAVVDEEPEEDDPDALEDDLDEDEEIWESQSVYLRTRPDVGSSDNSDWTTFLRRASERSKRNYVDRTDGYNQDILPGVWEVGCTPGWEFLLASQLSLSSEVTFPVIACPSMPGRVYVQASTRDDVRRLASQTEGLNSDVVLAVVAEELHRIITTPLPSVRPMSWAQVCGRTKKWRLYRGDVGLVVERDGSLVVLLLPRIALASGEQIQRPPQSPLCLPELVSTRGENSVHRYEDGSFVFRGHLYNPQGFLIVELNAMEVMISDHVVPVASELSHFLEYGLANLELKRWTTTYYSSRQLVVGDRVKVTGGDFRNLLGYVEDVLEEEYVVAILPFDLTEAIPKRLIRAAYRPGDQVKILSGNYTGVTGWVVKVSENEVTVVNLSMDLESKFWPSQLEFYQSDFVATNLRPRKHQYRSRLGKRDPNEVYIGKRVVVVGTYHRKGYLGLIRETTPDGFAMVELDATHTKERIGLTHLAIAHPNERYRQPITPTGLPVSYLAPSTSDECVSLSMTPLPTPSSSGDIEPAWDPSSRTPRVDVPVPLPEYVHSGRCHWLHDTDFEGFRWKANVREHGENGDDVVVGCVESDRAQVYGRLSSGKAVWMSLDLLIPAHPTTTQEAVTPLCGPLKGQQFVVKVYGKDICTIHKRGVRLRRGERDPEVPTRELALIRPGAQKWVSATAR